VYEFTAERGGSISAEHGLGQMKNEYMGCAANCMQVVNEIPLRTCLLLNSTAQSCLLCECVIGTQIASGEPQILEAAGRD